MREKAAVFVHRTVLFRGETVLEPEQRRFGYSNEFSLLYRPNG